MKASKYDWVWVSVDIQLYFKAFDKNIVLIF